MWRRLPFHLPCDSTVFSLLMHVRVCWPTLPLPGSSLMCSCSFPAKSILPEACVDAVRFSSPLFFEPSTALCVSQSVSDISFEPPGSESWRTDFFQHPPWLCDRSLAERVRYVFLFFRRFYLFPLSGPEFPPLTGGGRTSGEGRFCTKAFCSFLSLPFNACDTKFRSLDLS